MLPARFEEKVQREPGGRGWVRAHRYAYEVANGPIPDGLVLLHKCDNPSCVNPDHLHPDTQTENVRDMVAKGRAAAAPGERNGRAKLNQEKADELRARYAAGGVTQTRLAADYGVSLSQVKRVLRGEVWRS